MFDRERFLSGDREYVREVVREHSGLVLMVCQSYARDYHHAQDLYQEVWALVWTKAASLKGTGSFKAWLHRIATNVCISDHRGRKSAAEALQRLVVENGPSTGGWAQVDPLAETIKRELQRAIHRTLPELSDGEREALILRVIDGRSPSEVAEIMGVKPATVRSHVRFALKRLRKIMEDPDSELSRYRAPH